VRDGELVRGFTGGAGEIDYVRIPGHGDGGRGGSKLGDLLSPAALHPLEVALATGDPAGEEVQGVLRVLALGLASVVTVLDPELIVLGGRFGAVIGRAHADAVRTELATLLETDLGFVPAVRSFAVDATTAISGAERVALESARGIAFRSGSLTPTSGSPDPLAGRPLLTT
jgi:predicted NBD/HSP70 family sugar kinase